MFRGILDNVLSGMKACFEFILNFEHPFEREKMDTQKSSSKLSATLLALIMGASVFMAGQVWAAKYVTDPSTGKVVTAPQYGGTLTFAKKSEPPHTDSWFGSPAGAAHSAVVEKLADGNWGIDRNKHNFKSNFVPLFAITGQLAESWETPDQLTIVFKIRKGVKWHNKAPMNNRTFTAEDVVFNFHRLTGMGSGFTEPSTFATAINALPFESISATDKDTVVFKLKQPQPGALLTLLDDPFVFIQPPEVIRQHGDVKDWRNLVGTGPFMLTDWVEGSSMTWVKNPDYWGSDEKYPNNRLPYVDELRALILPEDATRLAALRSGKLDYIGHLGVSQIFTIDEAESLKKTNPEIALHPFAFRSETSFATAVRKPPFDDLRVRIALQKALDLETINETYFRGWAEWKPMGLNGIGLKGYVIPFDEWPEALKQEYTYDPEGAEALLDEAGYPRGANGIRFKTVLNHFNRWDLAFRELVADYWGKIGVDVEINVIDGPTFGTYHTRKQLHEGIIDAIPGYEWNPLGQLAWNTSAAPHLNFSDAQDPVYDAMVEAANAATTIEEQQKVIIEADMYIIKNHWYIWGGRAPQFSANQPWLIGYNGEMQMGNMDFNGVFARLWIDQALKKEMGF
jgi:peptide/nickel transport system substrate-binding protein